MRPDIMSILNLPRPLYFAGGVTALFATAAAATYAGVQLKDNNIVLASLVTGFIAAVGHKVAIDTVLSAGEEELPHEKLMARLSSLKGVENLACIGAGTVGALGNAVIRTIG